MPKIKMQKLDNIYGRVAQKRMPFKLSVIPRRLNYSAVETVVSYS